MKAGRTGDFPPSDRGAAQAYRRYRVAPEMLNWGGDNVLAVRVASGPGAGGGSGGGGLWSVHRDAPPRAWVVEGAPRWWTVVLVNWGDEPLTTAVPLDESERDRLVRRLEQRTKNRVRATFLVDPALISGTTIQLGDHLVDASLEARLRALARQLAS